MWTYDQKTGALSRNGGEPVATGYSGRAAGKNNPDMQDVLMTGPIPRGKWHITERFDHPEKGPACLRLRPMAGTETHGRSGFLVHGDSRKKPGAASLGCIILPRPTREAIWDSGDTVLEVV